MIIVGAGVIALVAAVVTVIATFERSEMERHLKSLSINEMTSLHAMILNVMAKRPDDSQNIGIQVYNNWYTSRNTDYPGLLWSVWGPKVREFMAQTEPDTKPKLPRDPIDEEALATKVPVGRMVTRRTAYYRYSYPIVLGVTGAPTRRSASPVTAAWGWRRAR